MWDNNAPLQLLNSMPKKLTKENLEKLQLVIDADKYKNSLVSGFDLCGMYAPFCRDCKKTSIYPCAIAYINMMKASGMDIEIDAQPVEHTSRAPEVRPAEEEVKVVEEVSAKEVEVPEKETAEKVEKVEVAEDVKEESEPLYDNKTSDIETSEVKEEQAEEKPTRRIRIAIARRKL